MKRLLPRLIAALITLALGITLTVWCKAYNVRVRAEQEAKGKESRIVFSPIPRREREGILETLHRIDEIYMQRCLIPVNVYERGDWQKPEDSEERKKLNKLSVCNDEWARARPEAILQEMTTRLVL
jgi:hypothetical protein